MFTAIHTKMLHYSSLKLNLGHSLKSSDGSAAKPYNHLCAACIGLSVSNDTPKSHTHTHRHTFSTWGYTPLNTKLVCPWHCYGSMQILRWSHLLFTAFYMTTREYCTEKIRFACTNASYFSFLVGCACVYTETNVQHEYLNLWLRLPLFWKFS